MHGPIKSLALTAAVAATLSLANAPADAIDLRFGHGATEDTVYHLGAIRFKELVEAATQGDVTVTIMSNGVLGHESEMFEQQMAGALDLSVINPGLITEFSPTANVFSIPFMYRDVAHWKAVLRGDVGREIADRIEAKAGVRIIGFFGGGVRQIVSTRALEDLDDLKGMKLRTNPTRPLVVAWSALRTQPTVMAWKEIYTGLQLGAIDGLLNEAEWIYRMRFHEVAPHIGLSEHDITVRLLTMSRRAWEELSAEPQRQVQRAAAEASKYARNLQLKEDREARDKLVAEGATLHPLNRDKMQAMVKKPLAGVVEEMGLAELHQKIVTAK